MRHITHTVVLEAHVQVAWQAQVAAAGQMPGLRPTLVRRHRELFPRFAAAHTQLRALPRRVRRALQRRFGLPLATLAFWLALGQLPALAATIAVGGPCTLVDAITAANTDAATGGCPAGSGADTIVLPPGSTHILSRVNNSTHGPTGLPAISSVITIRGQGSTIARASGAAEFRLLTVDTMGDLTLQETTVSGGASTGVPAGGGGVLNLGTLTITNSTIAGNSADYGGGVANLPFVFSYENISYGKTVITNSTISGNTAAGGGGVINRASTLTITNSTVSGNAGSGVANEAGFVYDFSIGGTLIITNSTISGNTADNRGGGVDNFGPGSTLTITDSTIAGNSGSSFGGGVANIGSAVITNSTISGNTAPVGGGVWNVGEGAPYYYNGGGPLTITNSTIVGNTAEVRGGGVANPNSSLTLIRTLVSGNTAPVGPEISNQTQGYGAVVADNHNLFGVDGEAGVEGFSPGSTDVVPPAGVQLSDILELTLADNGGPTQTLALVPGSPAIDAGGPVCLDADGEPLTTDQRGRPRPVDGNGNGIAACDIGAVEFQSQGPVVQAAKGRAERLGTANAKVTLEGRLTGASLADVDLGASTLTITSILNEWGEELVAGANLPLTLAARSGSDADGATFETPGRVRPKVRVDMSHRGDEVVSFRLVVEFAPSQTPAFCTGTPRTTELTTSFQLDPGPVSVSTTQQWQCLAGDSQLRVPVP